MKFDQNGLRDNDFIPTASIVAFVFIGLFLFITLIGRCLALNQAHVRSAQSSELMIYRAAPKQNSMMKNFRPNLEQNFDFPETRDRSPAHEDGLASIPVQRGPKNL